MNKVPRYWLRVTRGCEWLAAAEVSRILGARRVTSGHRDVFFESDCPIEPAVLRCPDDVFAFWAYLSGVNHTRESLGRLAAAARRLPEMPDQRVGIDSVHVTASFLGRRNYSRSEIEHAFGVAIADRLSLRWHNRVSEEPGTLRVRIHLAGDSAVVGVGLAVRPLHRRPWRFHTMQGMLHPPVAAGMALLADLRDGASVGDPFAGSGTLLIEAGLRCGNLRLSGWDIDPLAVAMARDHAAAAGVNAHFECGDSMRKPADIPALDRVLSNPPWGRSVMASGTAGKSSLEALLNLLGPETIMVAVADRSMELASYLEAGGCRPEIVFPVRVSGRIADIAVVSRIATHLWPRFGAYWKAMEQIPWEGQEGEATLNVPVEWGPPIAAS